MGVVGTSKKVKLFCGIIFSSEKIRQKSLMKLENNFGKIDLMSDIMVFNFSNYYNHEMGDNLKRFWISFEKLIFTADISGIKIFTNSIENEFAINSKRQINIDPGYVGLANVILATTKDYSHRIYLSKGIYGEVTVVYKKNVFIKLPWSYPDYVSEVAVTFLLKIRSNLVKQLKK
jgi:hypothetical protein